MTNKAVVLCEGINGKSPLAPTSAVVWRDFERNSREEWTSYVPLDMQ
jgi:hypothetical protein